MLHVLAIVQAFAYHSVSIEKNQFSMNVFITDHPEPQDGLRFLETMGTCAGPIIVFDKTVRTSVLRGVHIAIV